MTNVLRAGEVRTGFLTDGQYPDLVAASLTWTERGPELSVPGAPGRPQFEVVEDWFRRRRGGIDLLFTDDRGTVTLSDVRYAGHHGNAIRVTKATARNATCGHPRELPTSTAEERLARAIETPIEPSVLSVEELYSTIDGLARFSGFGRIEVEETDPDHPERISLARDLNEKLAWTVDVDELPFTLQYEVLRTTPWRENDDGVTVRNEVVVQTRWLGGNAQPEILLWQQYPLRSLLVLAYSQPIQWRTHHVRGQSFPTTSRGIEEPVWTPAFIADTAQGTFQDPAKLEMPLFEMRDLGPEGMRAWFERWLEEDSFRNPMQSAIEALSVFTRFLEPRVMLLVNTLEALGGWVTGDPHKRMPLVTAIEKCARASGGEWSDIGDSDTDPEVLIARFLATLQNDLKHGQRGQRRSLRDLRFAERLSAALIRMTALHGIPIDENAARYARASLVEDVENDLGQDELAIVGRSNGTDKNGKPKTSTEGVLRRAAPGS